MIDMVKVNSVFMTLYFGKEMAFTKLHFIVFLYYLALITPGEYTL